MSRGTLIGGGRTRPLKEDLRRTSLRLVFSATAPGKSQPVTHRLAKEPSCYCILLIPTLNAPTNRRTKWGAESSKRAYSAPYKGPPSSDTFGMFRRKTRNWISWWVVGLRKCLAGEFQPDSHDKFTRQRVCRGSGIQYHVYFAGVICG